MSASSRCLAAYIALIASSAVRVASAEVALDCPSSSEEGQRLRDKNKYFDARVMFRACGQASCPAIVRKDCAKWLGELDESQPSIVIAAQDVAGADLANVRVTLDDREVASHINGSALIVDPGEHTLRVEAAEHAPLAQHLIIRVNEKNRIVRVVLQRTPSRVTLDRSAGSVTTTKATSSSGVPWFGVALTGVAALAFGSFGYFGLTAKNDLDSLRSTCAPYCDSRALDDVKSRMLVADVSLGAGLVALGIAVVVFATHRSSLPPVETRR